MMVSTKGRYALRVMIELAGRAGEGWISLKDVAQRQQISEKYLEAIMKSLVKEGLVEGLRGTGGGYQLAVSPQDCTVAAILRAAEGSLTPVACQGMEGMCCPRQDHCATLLVWKGLEELVNQYLDGITLEELVRQTTQPGGCNGTDGDQT